MNRKQLPVVLVLVILLSGCAPTTPSSPAIAPAVPTMTSAPTQTLRPALTATPVPLSSHAISPDNAGRVVEITRWGKGQVYQAFYSPDGQQIALVTSLGVYVYDAHTLTQVSFLEAKSASYCVAVSPDWKMLAWAEGNQIKLLRLSDGSLLRTLKGRGGAEAALTFSPDGSLLVSIARPPGDEVYTGFAELWRVSDGTLLKRWDSHGSRVVFSPDGKLLATCYAMTGVRLWQVTDGVLLRVLESGANHVAFSPDGKTLATAEMGGAVRLWRVSDGTLVREMKGDTLNMVGVMFSPNGEMLASISQEGTTQLWQAADGKLLNTFDSSSAVTFSSDNQVLVVGAGEDVRLGGIFGAPVWEKHAPGIRSMVISPDGTIIATLAGELSRQGDNLRLWRVSDGSSRALPEGNNALSLAFSPDGTHLALGMWDGTLRLLRASDGQVSRAMKGHTAQVQSVAFSPDGTLLASSAMQEVSLWRVGDGTLSRTIRLPRDGWMESVVFSPDGNLLASLSLLSGQVYVWQVSDGGLLSTLDGGDDGYVGDLAFSADGTMLALGKNDSILLWQVPGWKLLRTLQLTAGQVTSIALSPDGALLASGSSEGAIQLWQVSNGSLLHTLTGHTSGVSGIVFSSDGQLFAFGSGDGTVRLWKLDEFDWWRGPSASKP